MPKATRAAEALSPTVTEEDRQLDLSLRPTRFAEYIGQTKAKENLRIYIKAALKRREALDHVLLTGPPGLGKTTLAHIVANEMGAQLRSTSGPAIEKTGDIAALLTNLQEGDVLFIDEIHRLLPALEEKLYPAMEDFSLDLLIGQGPGARSIMPRSITMAELRTRWRTTRSIAWRSIPTVSTKWTGNYFRRLSRSLKGGQLGSALYRRRFTKRKIQSKKSSSHT